MKIKLLKATVRYQSLLYRITVQLLLRYLKPYYYCYLAINGIIIDQEIVRRQENYSGYALSTVSIFKYFYV